MNGQILWANRSFTALLAYSEDELVGRALHDIVHTGDRVHFAASMQGVTDTGEECAWVYRLLAKSGDQVWTRTRLAAASSWDDMPAHLVATAEDITELQEFKDKFHSLVEFAPDAIVVVDEIGKIVLINNRTEALFGYDREELVGRPVEVLVPPDRRERHAAVRQTFWDYPDARAVGSGMKGLQARTKTGAVFPIEIDLSPIITRDSRLVAASVRDISARLQAENELERNRELLSAASDRLTAALDALPANIALLNGHGEITLVNSKWGAFAEANGYTGPGAGLRRNYLGVCAKAKNDGVAEAAEAIDGLEAILNGQSEGFSLEYPCHTPTEQCWFQMSAAAVPNGQGVIVMHTDITHRREAEGRLRHSQKMEAIGQLTGGIAHDFNNLLMIVDGYTRRAANNLHDEEIAKTSIDQVLTATDKAANLTKQLLVLSRRQVMEKEVFRVDDTLTEMRELLGRSLSEQFKLSLELGAGEACIETDPGDLGQAIINLVVNARDAMPTGGEIVIGSRVTVLDEALAATHADIGAGSFVEIFVKDQGSGIDKVTRQRIFEPFYTTKEQSKGTGLGLAMVYGFSKQSDGTVEVLSSPGEGSTFTIYLPLVDREPAIPADDEIEEVFRGEGETILLIEDDKALLDLTREMLVEIGYNVVTATDGLEAIEVDEVDEHAIDLLLSDVVMPGLGGFEAAEIIRQRRPDMKVVFMSGYPARGDDAAADVPENAQFLQKPVRASHLAQVLRRELDGPTLPVST
jgi:PAS domain S-box-containing protein